MRNSCESHGPSEHGSLLSTPSILAGFGEWRRDAVWKGGAFTGDRLLELRVCVPCAAPQLEAAALSIAPAGPVLSQRPIQ